MEEGGLWAELAYLTPLPNNPLQYVNVFVRKYTRYVYVRLKSFTCYKKSLKGGVFSSNSAQTPTNRPKTRPSVSLESHGKTIVSLHPEH